MVSLVDRVASEVEALLRWPRNGRQILAPPDFIAIAQQFGLIPELERWAIDAAFDQMAHWQRATDLDVALNISEEHAFGENLPEEIHSSPRPTASIQPASASRSLNPRYPSPETTA